MTHVYWLSFNKMILGPVILVLFFRFILGLLSLPIDPVAFSVVILQCGTPCMTVIVVLAKRFKADDVHATENVFVTTLFSLFTLPFLNWMIEIL
jgi:malate permease and related proteins